MYTYIRLYIYIYIYIYIYTHIYQKWEKQYMNSNIYLNNIYIIYIISIWKPFKYVLDKQKKVALKAYLLSKYFAFFTEASSV